jgi:LmbE family N-acetylglucosaminyl deacetylase
MEPGRSVLAIGAHPDDVEILCGGTLARYANLGWRIHIIHVTNGDKGGYGRARETIARERREEALRAAAVIGATSLAGGIGDAELDVTLDSRIVVIDAIRASQADVVLAHSPADYHPDHSNVGRLAAEAVYLAGIPALVTEHRPVARTPRLFFFDTLSGIGFQPGEYVDISAVFEVKRSMLAQHASQLAFCSEHTGVDLLEMIEVCARFRGYQCNVRYAEGFCEHLAWPIESTSRILP